MLVCTPQAYEACACPASRPKKEPGVSNRDISGLMEGGSLHVWSKVLERHPTVCIRLQWRAGHGSSLRWGFAGERLPVIGELMSGGLISYQRNQQRGTPLTAPLIRTITSWGLGQVHRKVSPVSKI